ncbi:MAG: crosslink repair DNA glycosylase YcaQ family protein [Chloroflexia bacterium]
MNTPIPISPTAARRLAVTRQRLAGPRPAPTAEGLVELVRDLGCVQLDPISAVARTNLLVPWSRLGNYDPAIWDQVLWRDRSMFEYFAHAAAIVLTEDFPIHGYQMRRYHTSDRPWVVHIRQWMKDNHTLLDNVMSSLRERGPLSSKDFEEKATVSWWSSGWTNDRNINRMLDFLWLQGIVLVAERRSQLRYWDLAEHVLPDWTPRQELSEREVVRQSAQRAIRALGVARKRDILQHFTRNRYWELPAVLTELEKEGRIVRVQVEGEGASEKKWAGPWYTHCEDLSLIEQAGSRDWEGRTTLLSPFDNLICDRARTELLWDFDFRIEIYVPKDKRKYGYYVLPILHGDRLIGRIDPLVDRKAKRLNVNNVYAEPNAPMDLATGKAIAGAIEDLAAFIGARDIAYGENVPEGWRTALR